MLRRAVSFRLPRGLKCFALGLLAIGPAIAQVESATNLEDILFPNQHELAVLEENHSLSPAEDSVPLRDVLFPNLGDFDVLHQNPRLPQATDLATLQKVAKSKGIKIPLKYDVTKIGDRGIEKGINFYSFEREQALGKDLSRRYRNDEFSRFISTWWNWAEIFMAPKRRRAITSGNPPPTLTR